MWLALVKLESLYEKMDMALSLNGIQYDEGFLAKSNSLRCYYSFFIKRFSKSAFVVHKGCVWWVCCTFISIVVVSNASPFLCGSNAGSNDSK